MFSTRTAKKTINPRQSNPIRNFCPKRRRGSFGWLSFIRCYTANFTTPVAGEKKNLFIKKGGSLSQAAPMI